MKKIVDLSMVIEEGMQTFAAHWHPFVELSILGRHGLENRQTTKIVMGTHTGTHIDAPRHFIKDGKTVDQIKLSDLNGPAIIIDCTIFPNFSEISKKDLIGLVDGRSVERLVARFNWDEYLGSNEYYSDHAFFSTEACEWLVENGCKVLALDTPQPDNPKNGRHAENDAPNHHILLGSGVTIVEYLVNLKNIPKDEFFLIVAPLKIKGADGAPARCFAIMNDI